MPTWITDGSLPKKPGNYVCEVEIEEFGIKYWPATYAYFDGESWFDLKACGMKATKVRRWLEESDSIIHAKGGAGQNELAQTFTITRQITVSADKLPMPQATYEALIDQAIRQILSFPNWTNYSWENRTVEPETKVDDIDAVNLL
ncbi:MAG TPA: hypothetical protein VGN00_14160 [Puia sp.]|jgi:hypothetical protein